MKYDHPNIQIAQPAPGHYVITGHAPASVFVENEGTVVPLTVCYITPEVPADALRAILEDRGELAGADAPKSPNRPITRSKNSKGGAK
jgi:hypothetical protein